ncbi:ABC transporter permease [Acuticoccus kandeliae]|uniref:ABC transporter permease n=1 Tax=Acuticoccus kandeliae TaxID=2073160 RepID=UPI000D3ED943|nr:ABC transporter permease [Acuticoccus kandeliae]
MNYILAHPDQILKLLGEHAAIVFGGILLAVVIAVPLGILVDRFRRLEMPVLLVTGLLYITPSLALFAFLIPITGLGTDTAIIGQAVYSLLVITRNTAVGLAGVPAAQRETAIGLGLSDWQRLRMVDLPAALPLIVAGIRVAAVMGVGIATIAAYIGAGGLGRLVFRGIATLDNDTIVAGVLPIVLLALALDAALRQLERLAGRL